MSGQMLLLPADALSGVTVGISASDSQDLSRLGFVETHFRLAVGEIARCVVVSGGRLSYAGRIDPTGYTAFLVNELQRFSRRDRPLLVTLSFGEHRSLSLDQLRTNREEMGLFGSIECLDAEGRAMNETADRQDPAVQVSQEIARTSLTAMRKHLAEICDARVLIGGRRTGYIGAMPGLIEECIFCVEHKKPVYLVGGFGGVTLDIVKALGVDDGAWFPAIVDAPAPDESLLAGLKKLSEIVRETQWDALENGLTPEENKKLTATHRPSEIAALISLGLGRKFAKT